MPRNGSGIYFRPPGIDGIPDHSIESAKYNLNVADVETDLNTVRPIVAGGTGATNARDAILALGGEFASQQVSNYDSFPFLSGSFFSGPGATGAPNPTDFFAGICYAQTTTFPDLYLEARSFATDTKYIRRKGSTGWLPWYREDTDLIAYADTKVAKAGDTMTGSLAVNGHVAATTGYQFQDSGKTLQFNTGVSSFVLDGGPLQVNSGVVATLNVQAGAGNYFFQDTGKYLKWDTGVSSFVFNGGPLQVNSGVVATLNVQAGAGTYFFQDATKYLKYDTGISKFVLNGGPLQVNGDIGAAGVVISAGGLYSFQDAGKNLKYDTGVSSFVFNGGPLQVNNNFLATGNATAGGTITALTGLVTSKSQVGGNANFLLQDDTALDRGYFYWDRSVNEIKMLSTSVAEPISLAATGMVKLSKGDAGRSGYGGAYDNAIHNFYWTGSVNQQWIDSTNTGSVTVTCDYRIKKDVAPLASTWEAVKALKPIEYTQAEFTPPVEKIEYLKRRDRATKENLPPPAPLAPMFEADSILRWGFIAHELQETLLPSAATGKKDQFNEVQAPNLMAICAALTRALQEAIARIEALEAR